MDGTGGVNRTEFIKSTQVPVVCVERDFIQALRGPGGTCTSWLRPSLLRVGLCVTWLCHCGKVLELTKRKGKEIRLSFWLPVHGCMVFSLLELW